jgi:hypothetical protein
MRRPEQPWPRPLNIKSANGIPYFGTNYSVICDVCGERPYVMQDRPMNGGNVRLSVTCHGSTEEIVLTMEELVSASHYDAPPRRLWAWMSSDLFKHDNDPEVKLALR